MRFLLDENISGDTEGFLCSAGHEVIRPPARAKDRDVIALARRERAILLTRDRDFLNFLPSSFSGIIYVRIHPSIAEHITQAVRRLLETTRPDELAGKIVLLRRDGYEIFG